MSLYLPDLIGLGALFLDALFVAQYGGQMADPYVVIEMIMIALVVLAGLRMAGMHKVGDWWVLLALLPFYLNMNQVIDATRRPLNDAFLISMDQKLLGMQPAQWFSAHQHPWLTEWFFVSYASYFGLVVVTGLVLARMPARRPFHAYLSAIAMTFALMLFGYICVPALGPRFTQEMAAPLQGLLFSAGIEDSFKRVGFFRDCFPSGHTCQTLVAIYFSARYCGRRYAAGVAVLGASIVVATLYCQFHYAFDLLAAVPLAVFGCVACELASRRGRASYFLPVPALSLDKIR